MSWSSPSCRCRVAAEARVRVAVSCSIQRRSSGATKWRVPRIGQERTIVPRANSASTSSRVGAGRAQAERPQRLPEILRLHGDQVPNHVGGAGSGVRRRDALAGQPEPQQLRLLDLDGHPPSIPAPSDTLNPHHPFQGKTVIRRQVSGDPGRLGCRNSLRWGAETGATMDACGSAGSNSTFCWVMCTLSSRSGRWCGPIVAELRRRFQLSVAEVGQLDLHRRSTIGLAAVASDRARVVAVLDEVERFVAERPEIELLSARRRLHASHDED